MEPTEPKPTPYDKKLVRLRTAHTAAQTELDAVTTRRTAAVADTEKARAAAELALQHARENAEAADEAELRLRATQERLRAELEETRVRLLTAADHRSTTVDVLVLAREHLTAQLMAVAEAGKPYDRWIAALTEDVRKYAYRIEQHEGRGPGSTALFVGVKG